MELNSDAGSPTGPDAQPRRKSGSACDVDRRSVSAIEQEQDGSGEQEQDGSGVHHRSPGRAARLALQAITRKLGRADVGANDIASAAACSTGAATAAVAHTTVERVHSGRLLNGEAEETRLRRERQTDNFSIRPTGSFQPSYVVAQHQETAAAAAAVTTTSTGTSTTANGTRDSMYARKDPRIVEASSAPLVSVRTRTHGSDLRRRARGTANPTTEAGVLMKEPCASGETGRGPSYNPSRDTATGNSRRRQHQQQERLPSSTEPTAGKRSGVSGKSPPERYLLLSLAFILAGLTARYLWRQLAGLAGAMLILASAKRWTGKGRNAPGARCGQNRTLEESDPPAGEAEARDDAPVDASVAGGVGEWGGAFAGAPAQLSRYWEDGGSGCQFFVRGSKYMSDRKKIPSGRAAMRLVHVDFFSAEGEVFHVASKGRCHDRVTAFTKSFEDRGEMPPFLFILNILVPGTPVVCTVMYWALIGGDTGDKEAFAQGGAESYKVFLAMLERYAEVPGSGYKKLDRRRSEFPVSNSSISSSSSSAASGDAARRGADVDVSVSNVSRGVSNSSLQSSTPSPSPPRTEMEAGAGAAVFEGTRGRGRGGSPIEEGAGPDEGSSDDGRLPADDFRNQRFKLIPSIVEGPFIVRKAVGNKPALLGRKLNQRYFRGCGYVETDVDVGSSVVAARIVGLCRGYAKSLTVELGVCLEGRCEQELPEKCIGVIRLVNLDLDGAEPLEEPEATVEDTTGSPVSTASDGTCSGYKVGPSRGNDEGRERHDGARTRASPGAFRMTAPASIAAAAVPGRAVATNA